MDIWKLSVCYSGSNHCGCVGGYSLYMYDIKVCMLIFVVEVLFQSCGELINYNVYYLSESSSVEVDGIKFWAAILPFV